MPLLPVDVACGRQHDMSEPHRINITSQPCCTAISMLFSYRCGLGRISRHPLPNNWLEVDVDADVDVCVDRIRLV